MADATPAVTNVPSTVSSNDDANPPTVTPTTNNTPTPPPTTATTTTTTTTTATTTTTTATAPPATTTTSETPTPPPTAASLTAAERGLLTIKTQEQLDELLSIVPRVILLLHAPWAAPCKQIEDVLRALHKTHTGIRVHDNKRAAFALLNAEALRPIAKRFNVTQVPTTLFISSGRTARRVDGADVTAVTKGMRWFCDVGDDGALTAACEGMVKRDGVVVALKGSGDVPKCAFCKRVVGVLRGAGVTFTEVDVLGDGSVRERLKEVAGWATYPMVFAGGRLIGGVDAIEKLAAERRLVAELARKAGADEAPIGADDGSEGANESGSRSGGVIGKVVSGGGGGVDDVKARCKALVKAAPVMVFMKGTPDAPRCGFSRKVVELLRGRGVAFGHFDILGDEAVRQTLKVVSEWPTYPQVYAGGNLVGGLDVVKELAEAGELEAELASATAGTVV